MGFCLTVTSPPSSILEIYPNRRQTLDCPRRKEFSTATWNVRNISYSSRRFIKSSYRHSEFEERNSPNEVREEIKKCYNLINKLGRGVVYLGSGRLGSDHPDYKKAMELAREIALLLDCTTWTGAGPGLMDAATKGALAANKPVGGFKIGKEAGEWTASNYHSYLPQEVYLTCRFFSARKHGLVDAAVRNIPSDRTAVVAFPGGIGTLDEIFEILALLQLERIGSNLPVPFLLLNYGSFYSKLLDFFGDCEERGTLANGEAGSLWKVCSGNLEALDYLADFYNISESRTCNNVVDKHEAISSIPVTWKRTD